MSDPIQIRPFTKSATKIDRRRFLKLGVLGLTGLMSAPLDSFASTGSKHVVGGRPNSKIIIAGAGLAGLSTAFELDRMGYQVQLLEARLRPGGRVHTIREPFSDELYAEAGAARFPKTHHLTMKYVREFNLPLIPFEPEPGSPLANVVHIKGHRYEATDQERITLDPSIFNAPTDIEKLGRDGLEEKYLKSIEEEIGDRCNAGWPSQAVAKYDKVTEYGLLRQKGATKNEIALITLGREKEASALWSLSEAECIDGDPLFKIRGGMDQLPEAFASRLSDKIFYGAEVTGITQDKKQVEIEYIQSGNKRVIKGDRLVCTIPFPVLKQINISPPLSALKQRAIQELPYYPIAKVFLQTRTRFWIEQGLKGFANADFLGFGEVWDASFNQPGHRGLLVAMIHGDEARRLSKMTEYKRIRWVINHLEQLFPGLKDHVEGGATAMWPNDPWVRGAFNYYLPGQVTSFYKHIPKPEKLIHFAGDHTSPFPGWMQGAFQSAQRVVNEITS